MNIEGWEGKKPELTNIGISELFLEELSKLLVRLVGDVRITDSNRIPTEYNVIVWA
jgi:hypothetical protein